MLLDMIYIVIGIILVLWGADRLTDGAVALAHRMGISEIVIGMTIVAIGTSAPEFCVSLTSALKGTTALAVGNVIGSNIFNTLLIVGIAALVAPMPILRSTVRRDVPFALLASILLAFMCHDKTVSRWDALILSVLFLLFMGYTLRTARAEEVEERLKSPKHGIPASVFFVLLGLACLIIGSTVFVNGATAVATQLGVSDAIIGLTIVAGGTSLPELATSVVAARKGQSKIAIGNVLGSNVFNILFVLGLTGLICPMPINGITIIDIAVMIGSITMLWLFSYTKYIVERWEGAMLLLVFLAYMSWLVMSAMQTIH